MQVYLTALEVAFERDMGISAEVRALAKRVAGFHSGFVANAAASAAKILQGGIAYAFKVQIIRPVLLAIGWCCGWHVLCFLLLSAVEKSMPTIL